MAAGSSFRDVGPNGDEEGAKKLSEVSSLAIRHINLGGTYHYSDEETSLDVDEILSILNGTLDNMLSSNSSAKKTE